MPQPLSFHIRHEVTPERTKAVFGALAEGQPAPYVTQSSRQETRLRQLGLVAGTALTEQGSALWHICHRKPELWGDLLHVLHYTLWHSGEPTQHGYSWFYRQCVHMLWKGRQLALDDTFLKTTVASLISQADTAPYFSETIALATRGGTVSLSTASIKGVLAWLEALQPSVIEEGSFQQRSFCPPELLLLALGWVAQELEGELAIDFLLTPARRTALCQLCLLDPAALA